MKLFLILTGVFVALPLYAQMNLTWEQKDSTGYGAGNKIVMDDAGYIYACGKINNAFVILKYDTSGTLIWKKQPIANGEAQDMIIGENSNIYVAGIDASNSSEKKITLKKYNQSGNLIGDYFGEPGYWISEEAQLKINSEGDILLHYGIVDLIKDTAIYYVKKFNPTGNLVFDFNRSLNTATQSKIALDENDNIYLLYYDKFLLEKLTPSGIHSWESEVAFANADVMANDIYTDQNSNIYLVGSIDSWNWDFITVKYTSWASREWMKFYSYDKFSNEFGLSIVADNNGNVYSSGDGYGNLTVKYDSSGVLQWGHAYTYLPGAQVYTRSMNIDNEGNIFIQGRYEMFLSNELVGKLIITKFNSDGNLVWQTNGTNSLFEDSQSFLIHNNSVYTTGKTGVDRYLAYLNVTRYSLDSTVGITHINMAITGYSLSQNYPNPFNPSTKISFNIQKQGFVSLRVFDFLGREIKTLVNESLQPGSYESTFDALGLSSGIYFYRLDADGFTETRKMILLK